MVEARPTSRRVDTWITRDSAEISLENDPLQHLDGGFLWEASEIIGGLPKISVTTGKRGFVQVYGLTDGKGAIQKKAPADIVIDHQRLRGIEIRNPISCIGCHDQGLNKPTTNGLEDFIASGAEAYALDYESIESFHLGDLAPLIDRHNEDYQAIVELISGTTADATSDAVEIIVRTYDEPVSLEDAARELSTTADELALAIGYASSSNKEIPARVVAMAHGREMPRTLWEQVYPLVRGMNETWVSRN